MYDITGYVEAHSILDAVSLCDENSLFIAGGTDVLIKSRERKNGYIEKNLVGITRIDEIKMIYLDKCDNIIIGSTCTFSNISKNEIILTHLNSLAGAASTVGGPQVRNTGTLGGNICNGATSADTSSTMLALNAIIMISFLENNELKTKEMSIHDFYEGPGKVNLKTGELVTGFKILKENYENYRGHYIKFSPRNAMDIATLGCSILIKSADNKTIDDLRIAFGVAGPTPLRATNAEDFAKGKVITDETLSEIGEKCLETAKARDSWRGSKAFREQLIRELPARCIKTALKLD